MKRKYFSLIIYVCFAVAGAWYLSFLKNGSIKVNSSKMETVAYTIEDTDLTQKIHTTQRAGKVCISGEVTNPGIYEIEDGDRISDVIAMAGGTTQSADLYGLNLSRYVEDEDNIIIPVKGSSQVNAADGSLVNINTADKQSLMSLDGIGEKLAESIIDYRSENGGFKNLEEIKNINRIGDFVYNKIKDKITV